MCKWTKPIIHLNSYLGYAISGTKKKEKKQFAIPISAETELLFT